MTISDDSIKHALTEKFGEELLFENPHGMLAATVPAPQILKVLLFLKEELNFIFLTDIAAVNYPDRTGEELSVVYHIHNLYDNVRMRLKVNVPVASPDVFTATSLFPGANWMERETYDYFGIKFVGHPDLRRILNPDEMDYFPMRKQYTLEDPQRRDKDDEMFGR
jgi:NADH-quinone oxidoreductase subunit C